MIQSPLNYTGGKFRLLPQILPLFPQNTDTFVDLFCGGCNVGINAECRKVIYNDLDEHLIGLYNTFKTLDKKTTFEWIYQIIEEYRLSDVSRHGYDYYGCESGKGLGAYNRKSFLHLREDFNNRTCRDDYYRVMLCRIIENHSARPFRTMRSSRALCCSARLCCLFITAFRRFPTGRQPCTDRRLICARAG